MREMKDSGIEWIGDIPVDWNLIPFRYVLKERQEKNSPIKSTERLSLSIDLGVTLYSEKTTNLDRFKEDFEQYKLARSGDLVMNSMNMIVGATGVSAYYGCVSPVYYTFYDELDDHCTAKFCEYIFRSKPMLRYLFSIGKGIYAIARGDDRVNTCRLKVSKDDLKSIIVPIPSVDVQRKIIKILNKKCAEIDAVIEKTKATIEEYKKLKQSVITEAVTKGIRGNRPMKDSGIEWIGEIPAEWDVSRLKNLAIEFSKGNGITKEDVVANGDTPCVRYGEIYTKYNQSFTECQTRTNKANVSTPKYFSYGDLLFTCTGELVEEIGKSIVYLGEDECLAGGDIIVLRHLQCPSFLNYAVNSNYAQAQKSCDKTKLKVVHISSSDIANIVMAVPNVSEQEEIAEYLDKKCTAIDDAIAKKTYLLKEMENYKKSVIHEYVTGKKEV